jgi:hypothetical protein
MNRDGCDGFPDMEMLGHGYKVLEKTGYVFAEG